MNDSNIFVGIDFHKRYSVISAQDAQGGRLLEARVEGNTPDGFKRVFSQVPGPCKVAMEACWNWGKLHDILEDIPEIEEIVLSHPYKTRIIAESQIKTDKIDARKLAELLRGNFICRAYAAPKEVRKLKETLRQRLYWVRIRTCVRNRVHILLDRQTTLEIPHRSDLFTGKGMSILRQLQLPKADQNLLDQNLECLELLDKHVKAIEKQMTYLCRENDDLRLLCSVPGLGITLAPVIGLEIDDITRFSRSDKLVAYSGLAPSTHSSGGNTYHGKMLWQSNRWLKWAFIEAAWVSIGCDAYLGSFYRDYRARGIGPNKAITRLARRMCKIVWQILTEKRPYGKRSYTTTTTFPERSQSRLTVSA